MGTAGGRRRWDVKARAEGGQCGPAPQKHAGRETGEGLSHAFPSGARHPGP